MGFVGVLLDKPSWCKGNEKEPSGRQGESPGLRVPCCRLPVSDGQHTRSIKITILAIQSVVIQRGTLAERWWATSFALRVENFRKKGSGRSHREISGSRICH